MAVSKVLTAIFCMGNPTQHGKFQEVIVSSGFPLNWTTQKMGIENVE